MAFATLALATLAVGFGASAADAPGVAPVGRAAGLALQVRIPGFAPISHAPALSRGGSATSGGGYATHPDPSIASILAAETTVSVVMTEAGARGDATSRVAGITLLDGLITARSVTAQAAAGAALQTEAHSGLRSVVEGLVVAGQPVETSPNRVIAIAGVGDLVVEESVDAIRGPQAARSFTIALHLRVRQDYRGLPAGTEILVGYADAGAAVPDPTSLSSADPAAPIGIDPSNTIEPPVAPNSGYDTNLTQSAPPGGFSLNPPITVEHQTQLLDAGYMFPVLGATANDFSDDWGAPRADTGFHQGIDIFAAGGTPLLAVQDGTVFQVGWNNLGGRRLWLADGYGNLFYYAHLSGFSPLATEGAKVKRGDVVGFVGNSGDAQNTPPHVHFEIHAGGGWAVPPFAYVMTWLTGVRQPIAPSTVVAIDPANTAISPAAPKPKPQPKPPKKPPETAPFETLPIATSQAPTTTVTSATTTGMTADQATTAVITETGATLTE